MSSPEASSEGAGILVEVYTMFMASDRAEAEAILDQVMDAELAVVCPSDKDRLTVCSHCHGTTVNPSAENGDSSDEGTPWAAGLPCAVCAKSDYPGKEMACVREHAGGATIHPDGSWTTGEDRRLAALLRSLLAALEQGDIEAARALVREKLSELG